MREHEHEQVHGLDELRSEINRIDETLVKLFKERMDIVSRVAEYKIANSMQVLDREREEAIIHKHLKSIGSDDLKGKVEEFLEDLMRISRKAQKEQISKWEQQKEKHSGETSIIGFQGVEASFSHQALLEYFGHESRTQHFATFRDVFEAIRIGEIKYGVLPIENSSTGGITEVYDLLGEYGYYIVGEKCIKVDHNLLGISGTELSDIVEVYSHSQGFMQSKDFFELHKDWRLIPYYNTAKSAEYVSSQQSISKACVASRAAAEKYGLEILKENINDSRSNYTRFIIVGNSMELDQQCDKITIVMTLKHKPGTLYQVLKHFYENDSNMMKIESRPTRDRSWEYSFYIDFQGNILDEKTKQMLDEISQESTSFHILGNYRAEKDCI